MENGLVEKRITVQGNNAQQRIVFPHVKEILTTGDYGKVAELLSTGAWVAITATLDGGKQITLARIG
jgi:hypothetical protein